MGIFFSVILCTVGSLFVYTFYAMDSINYKPLSYAQTVSQENTEDLLTKNTVLNVCFFGLDKRVKSDTKSRSDSTLLISINNSIKKIKLVSFMRDIYTKIPGYKADRLNVAIACGGENLAIKTLQKLFKVKIDKYVTVDFNGFRDIIDTLEGIEIALDKEETKYINGDIRYYHCKSDPLPEAEGTYILDGAKALAYSRARKIPTPQGLHDDFARTYRQRTVISAIIKKMKQCNLQQIKKVIDKIGPYITTDFKKDEIVAIAKNFAKYLKYPVDQFRLPTDDNVRGENICGMAVLTIPNIKKARYDLAKFLYEKDLKGITSQESTVKDTLKN